MKQVLSFASHKRWVLAFQSLPSFATVHFALSLLLMVKRSDRSLCEEKRPLENPGWSKLGCGAGACDLRAFDGQGTQAPLLFHTLMLNSFVHAALLQGTDADHLYGSQFAHYWTQMRAFAVPRKG